MFFSVALQDNVLEFFSRLCCISFLRPAYCHGFHGLQDTASASRPWIRDWNWTFDYPGLASLGLDLSADSQAAMDCLYAPVRVELHGRLEASNLFTVELLATCSQHRGYDLLPYG